MRRQKPEQQPCRRAAVAHIQHLGGFREPAQPDAVHSPDTGAFAGDGDSQRAERGGGGVHILALQQAGDPGAADGHATQHQRAMRDGFVTGNIRRAGKGVGRAGMEGAGGHWASSMGEGGGGVVTTCLTHGKHRPVGF